MKALFVDIALLTSAIRRALIGAWLVSGITVLSPAQAAPIPDDLKPLHVLNRLAYGPAPGELEKVRAMGVEKYIEGQLAPPSIPEPESLTRELDRLETLRMDPVDLFREYGPPRPGRGRKPDPGTVKAARERARVVMQQAVEARLRRATQSPRQLREAMTDFWYNHFNVFAGKGLDHLWAGAYEQRAIRPHALRKFRDLLGATARHPAMLFYLDNWQNTAPGSRGARGKFQGLNENYARELMELHTLGADGGYSQDDVIALARILTGWGLGRPRGRDVSRGGFVFDPKRHDLGDKMLLGQTIRGSGVDEGEQALDILARHPATARHIGFKLAQYFVADDPPAALVTRLSRRFLDSDGDIREVLNALFHSPEFWDEKYYGNKFKTPYRYLVSAVRAADLPAIDHRPLYGMLLQLGMPLYGCLTPDGYKNTREAWLNPDAMTRRVSFATALASGRLPLSQPPQEESGLARNMGGKAGDPSARGRPVDAARLADTLGNRFSPRTKSAIAEAAAPLRAALILGSPEFMQH